MMCKYSKNSKNNQEWYDEKVPTLVPTLEKKYRPSKKVPTLENNILKILNKKIRIT